LNEGWLALQSVKWEIPRYGRWPGLLICGQRYLVPHPSRFLRILRWETFTDAANEAGMSRRYGGIHFRAADLAGRFLGRVVAAQAWSKAQSYFGGLGQTPPER
jgi:hypothetical protein